MSTKERSAESLATSLTREDLLTLGAEALAGLLFDVTQEQPELLGRLRRAVVDHQDVKRNGSAWGQDGQGTEERTGPYLVGNSPVMRTTR